MGDTGAPDPLANVVHKAIRDWAATFGRRDAAVAASLAIRAAVADGTITPDVLGLVPERIYDVGDYAGPDLPALFARTAYTLPGALRDEARWACAVCDQPIAAEPHTDSDGEDVHADCCESCHPERGA